MQKKVDRVLVSRLFVMFAALLFAGSAAPALASGAANEAELPVPQPSQAEAPSGDVCEPLATVADLEIPGLEMPGLEKPGVVPATCPEMDCFDNQDCSQACPSASSAICSIEGSCVYNTSGSSGPGSGGSCDMDCNSTQDCVSECGSQWICNSQGTCE